MPVVAFPGQPADPAHPATGVTTGVTTDQAVERFLASLITATTRSGYADTLARLIAVTGLGHPVAELTPEQYATVMERWHGAAAATWNRHLSALVSLAHSNIWPRPDAPRPNCRPRAATSTWPASAATSASARRPPPASPPNTIRQHADDLARIANRSVEQGLTALACTSCRRR
ncbi:hypothetical protein ACFOY2_49785 [Nonomuraea purpurea]|uniref:Core-binding (CB) domain-containing protein n=1 Tax=Nonomuraea purpurea TaxID=1849276 RepID=A0ABV8GRL9_9ACTN